MLLAATAVLIALSVLIVLPFMPAIAWAVAFAIVADPIHKWIARRIGRRPLAAGMAVAVVAVILIAPMILATQQIVAQAARGVQVIQSEAKSGDWRAKLRENPMTASLMRLVESQVDIKKEISELGQKAADQAGRVVAGSLWGIVQLAIALFVLFYLFRDREYILWTLRSLIPLSHKEANELFDRTAETIHATVFGTLAVAFIQGALGGIMFAILGIPGAVVWGAVMFIVAVIPMLGAFLIWGPVALYLALQGSWGKALVLAAWGSIVIGLIDNLLYPMLVGQKLRLHTAPVFFSIVGGLFAFGGSGIVIGPVVLATTLAVVEFWRRRTEAGRPAEAGVDTPR